MADQFGATAYAPNAPPPQQHPMGAPSPSFAQPPPPPPPKQQSAYAQPPPPPPPPAIQDRGQPSLPSVGPDGRRALVGFLVSYQDDTLGRYWALWQGKNSVGRAETGQKVDIEIAHGTTSTHHATIECEGPRFILADLGSTNGTFHNEEAIGFQGRRELRDGDKIRFGGYSVMVINVVGRS